jgi:hypothetical protein
MEMLEYMVGVHPASVDGYWRLANLCREQGENETALEHYRKCLEIMPSMSPARYWIDQLQKGE